MYLLKEKSDVEGVFKEFYSMIETQFHTRRQVIRTDNEKEYFNSILGRYFKEKGIIHQSTCFDTPQQNGIAERKNRHLLEVARSIMFTMGFPKYLWGEVVLTASCLINRMPTRVLKFATPLNRLLAIFPHICIITFLPLKIFGCIAFVHIQKQNRSKLDPRSEKCMFVSILQHRNKCYNPISKKLVMTMDVTFFENQPYFPKNHLQEESIEREDHFWEEMGPLPMSLPSDPQKSYS